MITMTSLLHVFSSEHQLSFKACKTFWCCSDWTFPSSAWWLMEEKFLFTSYSK